MDFSISRRNHFGINWIHHCSPQETNLELNKFKNKKIQLTFTHRYSEKKVTLTDVLEDIDTRLYSSVDFRNQFHIVTLKLKEKGELILLDGDEVDMCRRPSKNAQGYINSIATPK